MAQLGRHPQGTGHGAPRADPAADPLFPRQPAHGGERLLLGHIQHPIDPLWLEDGGHIGGGPAANAGDLAPLCRLQAYHLHRRVLLLEVAGDPHDGARGAHGRDEVSDCPLALAPDLGAGGEVVGIRVGRVVELIEHQPLAAGLHGQRQIPRFFHAVFHQHQLGAIGLHGIAPLLAHGARHDEPHSVPPGRRHHGQRYAGIARGGLDKPRSWP
ncbi:hypothetical protein D3C85_1115900 [compost metagenome]